MDHVSGPAAPWAARRGGGEPGSTVRAGAGLAVTPP